MVGCPVCWTENKSPAFIIRGSFSKVDFPDLIFRIAGNQCFKQRYWYYKSVAVHTGCVCVMSRNGSVPSICQTQCYRMV